MYILNRTLSNLSKTSEHDKYFQAGLTKLKIILEEKKRSLLFYEHCYEVKRTANLVTLDVVNKMYSNITDVLVLNILRSTDCFPLF